MTKIGSLVRTLNEATRDPDELRVLAQTMRERMHSDHEATGLCRELNKPLPEGSTLADLPVRPLESRDVPSILGSDATLSVAEKADRESRRRLLEAGIGTPFVAVTEQDEACYVQWLFGPRDNADLRQHYADTFPTLDSDTALLEGAFTPSTFRGRGIMSAGMARIAERAADLGARHVITFVGVNNIGSLKGCAKAGFSPYITRRQHWRLLRQRTTFHQH